MAVHTNGDWANGHAGNGSGHGVELVPGSGPAAVPVSGNVHDEAPEPQRTLFS